MSGKALTKFKNLGIPNMLSILRLILIPVFVVIYLLHKDYSGILAAVVLIVSGATDVIDGIIARKYNLVSALGKILDPLADKLTQATICICLVIRKVAPIWILCILIIKELIMIGAGANIVREGKEMMSSKWFGKLGTVVFYVVMISIIAFELPRKVVDILVGILLCFMIFSFIMYTPIFIQRYLKKSRK